MNVSNAERTLHNQRIAKVNHEGVYAIALDDNVTPSAILAVKKTRGPYQGLWDLPGGKPEKAETPQETLVREMREETGFEIRASQYFHRARFFVQFVQNGQNYLLEHRATFFTISSFDDKKAHKTFTSREDVSMWQWLNIKTSFLELSPLLQAAIINDFESPFFWEKGKKVKQLRFKTCG